MIEQWAHIALALVSVVVIPAIIVVIIRRSCCLQRSDRSSAAINPENLNRINSSQERIAKLHKLQTSDIKRRGNTNLHILRGGSVATTTGGGGFPAKPGLFSWMDHPSWVAEAVEYGWSRFGFAVHAPPPQLVNGGSTRTAIFGLCTAVTAKDPEVEMTWDVSNGSADFMQTIRFNHASREIVNNKKTPLTVLRGTLPLPGPQLGNSVFPQEAYFEVTVLEILSGGGECNEDGGGGGGDEVASVEGEKTKLYEGANTVRSGELVEENEEAFVSLGLTASGFAASIGFHSNGSLYLDGMKLVSVSEKHAWAKANKIIGCGYNPSKKKVYFTVDSHLIHVINCKADEFNAPLYPTIASNTEATIVVNFGQCPFAYGAANGQRMSNPRLIAHTMYPSAATAVFEESRELFSIGRIDSLYYNNFLHHRGTSEETWSGRTTISDSHGQKLDYNGEESDADLFEIAIESSGRQNIARS